MICHQKTHQHFVKQNFIKKTFPLFFLSKNLCKSENCVIYDLSDIHSKFPVEVYFGKKKQQILNSNYIFSNKFQTSKKSGQFYCIFTRYKNVLKSGNLSLLT